MNCTNKIIKSLKINLSISLNTFLYLRSLQQNDDLSYSNKTFNKDENKNELKDLFIYMGILVGIIILVLIGYSIYKKYIEKKALQEIEQENQYLLNLQNSFNSGSSSQIERRPFSSNSQGIDNQNYNYEQNLQNYSYEFNHEERMENIRKKYGNSMLIKYLLKKQIEEVPYNQALGEEFGDNCTICMDNFVNQVIIYKTPCEHLFHKECFDKYLKGIKKKDKLTCPNCNQNLLINKKFLKLRLKTEKLQIEKKTISRSKEKENIYDKDKIEYEEIKKNNNNSVMTNKNDENNSKNVIKNNNEIIFISRKIKNNKNKIEINNENTNINSMKEINKNNLNINNNKSNIFVPLENNENVNDKEKKISKKEKEEDKSENNSNNNNIKNQCIILGNNDETINKNNRYDNIINSGIIFNSQKNKILHLNKKKIKISYGENNNNNISSNSKDLSSQRVFINNKRD